MKTTIIYVQLIADYIDEQHKNRLANIIANKKHKLNTYDALDLATDFSGCYGFGDTLANLDNRTQSHKLLKLLNTGEEFIAHSDEFNWFIDGAIKEEALKVKGYVGRYGKTSNYYISLECEIDIDYFKYEYCL